MFFLLLWVMPGVPSRGRPCLISLYKGSQGQEGMLEGRGQAGCSSCGL